MKKKVLVHQPDDFSAEKATMAPAPRERRERGERPDVRACAAQRTCSALSTAPPRSIGSASATKPTRAIPISRCRALPQRPIGKRERVVPMLLQRRPVAQTAEADANVPAPSDGVETTTA